MVELRAVLYILYAYIKRSKREIYRGELFWSFTVIVDIVHCSGAKLILVVPSTNKVLGVYRNQPVYPSNRLSVHISCNFSMTGERILMKFHTVAVFNWSMCMKEDKPCPNYLKGDHY